MILAGLFGRQERAESEEAAGALANVKTQTLGGKQFWTDLRFFHGWHIQKNSFTGHCRLLDGSNVRHAWGTYGQCVTALEAIRKEKKLPAMKGKLVICLHGLGRNSSAMAKMAKHLREQGKYHVINFTYASLRAGVGDHARALASVMQHLDGVEEIHFVGHSLGNLVVRHYLADQTDKVRNRRPDPRIKRIVMLGPPNNAPLLAKQYGQNRAFELFAGQSGKQLGSDWKKLEKHLATPTCQFAVIAGGFKNDVGGNPLLPGDDDLVVRVEETRLPGARDFAVVPVRHTIIMDDPTVRRYTLRFLAQGHFISDARRQPIAAKADSK